jgi:signal transduction histidine kinase/ligand-binding sensor domain-containing protein/DNA-binding response OmpR family regulator
MKHILCVITCVFASLFDLQAQPNQVKFMHINRQSGLSGNSVFSIYQDSRNYIWFATDAGLNRFDGYNFKVFKTINNDSLSISNNSIRSIAEDNKHNLWIGTESGLNWFNHETELFTRFFSVPGDTNSLSYNCISSLKFHPSGDLYIGTGGAGLCRYNVAKGNFTRIKLINKTNKNFRETINDIICLPDSRLCILVDGHILITVNPENWIIGQVTELPLEQWGGIKKMFFYRDKIYVGGNGEIFVFDIKDNSLEKVVLPAKYGFVQGLISGIDIDNKGILWIGSTNNGIFLLDPVKSEITGNYKYDEYNPASVSGSDISSIFIDKTGKVWVGTWGSGVNYYHSDISKFGLISNTQMNNRNLPDNKINTFCQDKNNNIWIGSENGIAKYQGTETEIKKPTALVTLLKNNVVLSLLCDSKNNIWAGCFLNGLKKINPISGSIENIKLIKSTTSVKKILEVEPGILLLATMDQGVIQYNTNTGECRNFLDNLISARFVNDIIRDFDNNIWICTVYGLDHYVRSTGKIEKFFCTPDLPNSIAGNHVKCIRQLSDGHLVIGTSEGINILDKKTGVFLLINKDKGLQNDYICSVEEDNQKRIWVSSLNGLSCITIKSYEPFIFDIINYSDYQGIQSLGFRPLASISICSGLLLFGGNSGVNYFFPDKISPDNSAPLAIITGIRLNNHEVGIEEKINGHEILNKAITESKKVVLKYYENIISFDFAALNAVIPEKCTYKYKLEGFEEKWNFTTSDRRSISYTNLDPGEYLLKIRASNSDGKWSSDGVKLKIVILPPFWKTKVAIIIYIILILISLILLRKIIISKERKQSEEKLAIQEAKRLHDMDLIKMKFFTNVSHEFRTPLTLIITPLEKILKDLKYKDIEVPLQTVYRNSRRLLNLVNQLLDFRKMEVSGLKLSPTTGDIIDFLKEMVISFTDLAEKKQISFKFRSNIKELITQFDHDKMEKIIFNLLSNAFKYTIERGEIVVEIDYFEQMNLVTGENFGKRETGKELQVKVKDTGIGISNDKLEHIFERFMQIDKTNKIIEHGTGIGLSLTREFVKLHGGKIWAESEEGKGSCFTFTIPLDSIVIKSNQIIQSVSFENTLIIEDSSKKRTGLAVVMLIEDNEDLRFYLRDNLKQKYTIIEAANGKEGVDKAISEIPDLIISDIMMPELDGIELCQKLKNHTNTSHIPIILLTAKTSEEQQKAGFEVGADAYITKPFSFEILEMRIKNLIDQRKQLKSMFNKKIEINPSDISITSVDDKLIRKALEIVEKNISNAGFSVEQLGRELGMSRVHLYKKLLSLTGKTPIEFIRVLRLKRAAQLLQKSQLRVSEIAYEVGFNNPKYFSKYFREEFNMLPSEYASRNEQGEQ